MDSRNDSGVSIGAFLTGFVAGTFAAILFAPRSGDQVRKTIKDSADTMKSSIGDAASDARHSVNDTANDAKRFAKNVAQRITGKETA